jgi:hypothetical protein
MLWLISASQEKISPMPPKSGVLSKHSLAPWISVPVGAIDFYKSAFDATEVYHHDDPSPLGDPPALPGRQ